MMIFDTSVSWLLIGEVIVWAV